MVLTIWSIQGSVAKNIFKVYKITIQKIMKELNKSFKKKILGK